IKNAPAHDAGTTAAELEPDNLAPLKEFRNTYYTLAYHASGQKLKTAAERLKRKLGTMAVWKSETGISPSVDTSDSKDFVVHPWDEAQKAFFMLHLDAANGDHEPAAATMEIPNSVFRRIAYEIGVIGRKTRPSDPSINMAAAPQTDILPTHEQ